MAEHHRAPLPRLTRRHGALNERRRGERGWRGLGFAAAALGCLALGPLTLALALLGLAALRSRRPWPLLVSLPPSLAGAYLLAGPIGAELHALARSLHGVLLTRPGRAGRVGLARPGAALEAALPHLLALWLATSTLAPFLSLLALLVHRSALDDDPDGSHRRALERAERRLRARSAPPARPPAALKDALYLGRPLRGDPLLPVRRGAVYLPLSRLRHHLLVVGATGSGKTETVLRLVDSVARASDWRIVFLDGKGDRETAERFELLANEAGRRVWRFPERRYDGWRGTGGEVASRLLQLVDFAESGGGTYYRDLAVGAVQLACSGEAGPPRSSRELLRRLHRDALAELHPAGSAASTDLDTLTREQLNGIRARYAAFFTTVGGVLDGESALDDADCAYLLLDGLRLKQETGYLARFIVEDFTQWAVGRKPRHEKVLLVVDEFSAIATAGKGLVDVVERARGFGVAAVLCPQLVEGMGGPEASARLLGSAQTLLLHAMSTPERFAEAAGGRLVPLTTRQLDGDSLTGAGSIRPGRELRVDPDEVRRLKPGQCFAIGSGLAQKLQIAPMPKLGQTASNGL